MGAKKKNKGNKLARMSEEERIRYLQHRAAIEEEIKRRKEQLISTFLKNKLKREQVFSRLNVAKINQQWRYILRQIKCQELRQELEDLHKWFDLTLNKKNESIKLVLADLEEAESQYLKMNWIQMETFDNLIGIHKQRIDNFHGHYKSERDQIHRKAVLQINAINASHKEDEEQLEAALYRSEEAFERSTASMTSQHYFKMDELRNNMLTDFENLKNSRESQIEEIWRRLESTLKEYREQTEDRRRQYLIMRNADRDNCKQIFDNNQQINEVIDLIEELKDELRNVQLEGRRKVENRKADREKAQKLFHDLKRDVVNEMNLDKRNLNFMNLTAGNTTDELEAILRKGEQILKIYALCKNLESRDEGKREGERKRELTEDEEKQLEEQMGKFVEPLAEKASRSIVVLNKFWGRFNQVLLEKEALVLYNRALSNERNYLKAVLKSYFSEFVVKQPESKVSYANGVRFLQHRPSTTVPITRRNPHVPVTSLPNLNDGPTVRTLSVQLRKSVTATP